MNQNDPNNVKPEENFADMMNESLNDINNDFFEPGQLVSAQIVKITTEWIFINIGAKSEGYVDATELLNEGGDVSVKEGDTIKVYFLKSQEGELHFTTKITEGKIAKKILQTAYDSGEIVEGYVNKEIKGGFEVTVGNMRAFCPYSQMGIERESPEIYIGQTLQFKVTDLEENGRNIILSNRVILEKERRAKIEVMQNELKEGMKIKGTVKSVQDFGAFVDIGGFQALIPISEISRGRVENIKDYLKKGQEVEAVILNIDWNKEKISLSMKELIADPWEAVNTKYKEGSIYTGKIVRLTNFGAFVTLEPGLDGLIHISELGGNTRIKHPREVVKEGDSLEVIVDKIDSEKKRISLKLLRPTEETEQDSFEKFTDKKDSTYNPFGNLGDLLKKKE
ncbi:MAG: 30S ribosomal protein S1 [Spirochaetes bacterium]|nr:30S ribosomal protein S1 [Spirochaetota bacterium]